MKKAFFFSIAVMLLTAVCFGKSYADYKPVKTFSLSDGTTVKGAIIGIRQNDNAYLIETETMGTVAILPQDVIEMTTDTLPSAQEKGQNEPDPEAEKLSSSTIQQTKELLLSDPNITQSIQELMSNPEIVQLLQDPQVMQAVISMDPQQIQSNPKIQQLLQNPLMQKIIQESSQKIIQSGSP